MPKEIKKIKVEPKGISTISQPPFQKPTPLRRKNIFNLQEISGNDIKEIDIDVPVIFTKNTKIDDWSNTSKMQVALGSFGGRYKKSESFQQHGKAQMTIFTKEGKEECMELVNYFANLIPAQNKVTQETEFSRITDTLWLFGYDPSMHCVAPTPNGMAMLKVLAYGEVKWIVMECASLLASLRTELQTDSIGIDDLERLVGALNSESLDRCKKHGLKSFSCKQAANEAIYVPAGWIAVEQSVSGMLIYGFRATFLLRSEASHSSYESLIGLNVASGKAVAKMQQALDLMVPLA